MAFYDFIFLRSFFLHTVRPQKVRNGASIEINKFIDFLALLAKNAILIKKWQIRQKWFPADLSYFFDSGDA